MKIKGPRHPDFSELKEILKLADEAFRTPNAHPPAAENLYPLLYSKNNMKNLWVLYKNDNPVSLVGSLPDTVVIGKSKISIAWIGEVCTKKGYRNQGLATCLLEEAFSELSSRGTTVAIITGELNLYKRLNCVRAGSNKQLLIEQGKKNLKNPPSLIKSWNSNKLRSIYCEEKIRWERDKDEFSKLIAAQAFPREHDQIPRIYCIGDKTEEKAYWIVGLYSRPSDGTRELKLVEYAGDRKSLVESIPLLLKKEKAKIFSLSVPTWDRKLLDSLKKLSEKEVIRITEKEERSHPGTMKILNEDKLKESIDSIEHEFDIYKKNKPPKKLLSRVPWPWTENLNWM